MCEGKHGEVWKSVATSLTAFQPSDAENNFRIAISDIVGMQGEKEDINKAITQVAAKYEAELCALAFLSGRPFQGFVFETEADQLHSKCCSVLAT